MILMMMISKNMKKLIFDLNSAEDISLSFADLCSYLDLDKKKEETACIKKGKKVIDHEAIVNLCERNSLLLTLDFPKGEGTVVFEPKVSDISSLDDQVALDEEVKKEESKDFIEEVEESKDVPESDGEVEKTKLDDDFSFDDDEF